MVENVRLKYDVEASADKIKELEHEILVMHLRGANQQPPPPTNDSNQNVDNEIPEQEDTIDIEALEYDEQQAAALYPYTDNAFPRSPVKSPNGNIFLGPKKKETPAMTGIRTGFTVICNKIKDAESGDVTLWELRDELASSLTVR